MKPTRGSERVARLYYAFERGALPLRDIYLDELDEIMAYARGLQKRGEDNRKQPEPTGPGAFRAKADAATLRELVPEIFKKPEGLH